MLRRAPAVLLALLIACSSTPQVSKPVNIKTNSPGNTIRVVRARVHLTVSGAESIDLTTNTQLQIYVIFPERSEDREPQATWFLSVSSAIPIELPGGHKAVLDSDLSPGLYHGPGTYTLSDKSAISVGSAPGLASAAYVRVLTLSPPTDHKYDGFVKPCTLEVTKDQITGTVDCPALKSADGKTVSAHWSWQLT